MKKLLTMLALSALSFQGQSQVLISLLFGDKLNSPGLEFGLEGGFSASQLSGLDAGKAQGSLNLGLYFDVRIKNNFWLYTGFLLRNEQGVRGLSEQDLMNLGANEYSEPGEYSQLMRYNILPIFAKYKFDNFFYFEIGPQFGYLRDAYIEFEFEEQDNLTGFLQENNKSELNKLDFGLTAGTGYTLSKGQGLSLGIRYYYGLTDVYKDISGTNNSHVYLKLNIPIGKAKKVKAEKESGG